MARFKKKLFTVSGVCMCMRVCMEGAHIPVCAWQNVFLIAQGSSSLCLRRTYGKWEHLLSEGQRELLDETCVQGPTRAGASVSSLFKVLSIKTLMFVNPTLLFSGQWSWLQTGSSFWGSSGRALGVKHLSPASVRRHLLILLIRRNNLWSW